MPARVKASSLRRGTRRALRALPTCAEEGHGGGYCHRHLAFGRSQCQHRSGPPAAVISTASVARAQLAGTDGWAVPGSSGTKRPTSGPWPVKALAFIRFGPVVLSGTAAVGLVQVSQEEHSPQRLEAVDLATGNNTKGAQVPPGNTVIGYHGVVYVLGPNRVASDGGPIGPYVVRSVTTGTMSLGRAVPVLPSCARCYQLVTAFQPAGRDAGDLWVAGGTDLRLVRPATGQVLTSVGLTSIIREHPRQAAEAQ